MAGWKAGRPCARHDFEWCAGCKPHSANLISLSASTPRPVRASTASRTLAPASLEQQEGRRSNAREEAILHKWRLPFPLRHWQIRALDAWEKENWRGVVEAATGTGKTAVALGASSRLREAYGPSLRVVVVVPTRPLASQWVCAFADTLGVPRQLIGELHSSAKLDFSSRTAVLVTVNNTARTKLPALVDGWVRSGRQVLVIVDECHRAGSESNAVILDTLAQHTLGLSATPERTDGGHHRYVYPGIGKPVYRYSLLTALDEGVLAPIRSTNLYVDFTVPEQDKWKELGRELQHALSRLERLHPGITTDPHLWARISDLARKQGGDAMRAVALASDRRELIAGAAGRQRCLVAIEEWLVNQGHRSMVFHESIERAELSAERLLALGASVSLDHSGRRDADRARDLSRFRTDRSRVLVAVRSLDEGIDVPDASVAVIAAGSRSKRQRIQRLGRILRAGGDKRARAVSILVRSTPEESAIGGRDAELLGATRVAHHRWPGRSVAQAVVDSSTYRPLASPTDVVGRITAQAMEIDLDGNGRGPGWTPSMVRSGGYVASSSSFSANRWHPVGVVRCDAGMPPEEFDRLRSSIRTAFHLSLEPRYRSDPTLIHGAEIEAIRRTWERTRRDR